MIRKIVLLLCIAFAVVAFGFPCFVIPMLDYDFRDEDKTFEITYTFGFNGKVTRTSKSLKTDNPKEEKQELYYKIKKTKIIISTDKTFDESDEIIQIASIYRIVDGEYSYFNPYACGVSVGVALLGIMLVVTTPHKKYY